MSIRIEQCDDPKLRERIRQQIAVEDRAKGLRAKQPESNPGKPLDRIPSRETPRPARFEIVFTVYAIKPLDWDNWYIKPLQDWLVVAGYIPSDSWVHLEGRVRSRQAHSVEEERTEIEIYPQKP